MNIKKIIISLASATLMLGALVVPASADTLNVNFENPSYTLGTVNAQDGWSSTGSAGSGCAVYDHAVSGSLATSGFGSQSLRISNAVTSGCFGDQTFSKSLANEAGETSAVSDSMSGGVRQGHFESQFSLASAVPGAQQPGLVMSTSPDRGDGARMSYLRFEDQADGLHVFFDDYQDIAPFGTTVGDSALGCGVGDDFFETDIATLDRSVPHTFKLSMDFVDGPRNDVVKVYVDGVLKKTGTSWEDYFRYCEGNPTRPVDSMLFRTGGTAAPATLGNGFLIDNLTLSTGPVLVGPPTNKNQCKKDGWKTFNNPTFKNQGQCVSYVEKHEKDEDHDNDHHDKDDHKKDNKDDDHRGEKENHGKPRS